MLATNLQAQANKSHMNFNYTIAEYRCTKCSNTHSQHSSSMSIPFLVLGLLGTFAQSAIFLRAPWDLPWYYFFCIFAGELILLFISGFLLSMVKIISGTRTATMRCSACGASMTFRGRHIAKSKTPRLTDYVVLILFLTLNVAVWLSLCHKAS
jgi:DNA-directed RNA polymerase subunit RPC12/RpoP